MKPNGGARREPPQKLLKSQSEKRSVPAVAFAFCSFPPFRF